MFAPMASMLRINIWIICSELLSFSKSKKNPEHHLFFCRKVPKHQIDRASSLDSKMAIDTRGFI